MTFDKHFCFVTTAASQRLGLLRKSWQVFQDRLLLGRCFPGFCPARFGVLFGSVVLGADTHLKLLDRAVSDASFLTCGVFECDLAHCRSVVVLCMIYKIRCNPMNPIYSALPEPYVSV